MCRKSHHSGPTRVLHSVGGIRSTCFVPNCASDSPFILGRHSDRKKPRLFLNDFRNPSGYDEPQWMEKKFRLVGDGNSWLVNVNAIYLTDRDKKKHFLSTTRSRILFDTGDYN